MLETSLVSLFVVGLLGGAHCAGMCGGIVGALSASARRPAAADPTAAAAGAANPLFATLPGQRPLPAGIAVVTAARASAGAVGRPLWPTQLAYNAGRISSYAAAGALAGAAGSLGWVVSRMLPAQQFAFVLTNLMLILIGVSLLGGARVTLAIERLGQRSLGGIWQRLRPAAARALRAPDLPRAYAAGLLWGWVPCGMVYTALLTALVTGNPLHGALLMLAFGAGTLPNLLGLGWLASQAGRRAHGRWLAPLAGLVIVGFGLAGLARIDPLAHLHGLAQLCLTALPGR